MSAQIIRRNGEPEYAVLPYDEYEALVAKAEAVDDAGAFDRAVAELERGDDELVPATLVRRLSAGESPIKVWRDHRGYTQTELAERAGLSQSYVAMLESGSRSGGMSNLARVARALSVDLDELSPLQERDSGDERAGPDG